MEMRKTLAFGYYVKYKMSGRLIGGPKDPPPGGGYPPPGGGQKGPKKWLPRDAELAARADGDSVEK